jgi:UDP-galactopyranose mutase
LLENSEVKLEHDFFEDQKSIENLSDKIIYTGPIDKFFNFNFGNLEYRSLRFEHKRLNQEDFQGNAIINYTSEDVPWTRIVEHKHFEFAKSSNTVITKEYPELYNGLNEPFYPVNDDINKNILKFYNTEVDKLSKYHFGGRLATYNYYDMHQVVASALALVNKIL